MLDLTITIQSGLLPFLSKMMSCFSFLFAKKPSPDPSQSSVNIEEPREAQFNRCQDLSSGNDEQITKKPPVEVAAEEGENDFRNIVAGERSTQFIIGHRPTIAWNVVAGENDFRNIVAGERSTQFIIGHRPTIAWNVVAGNGACQVLGN